MPCIGFWKIPLKKKRPCRKKSPRKMQKPPKQKKIHFPLLLTKPQESLPALRTAIIVHVPMDVQQHNVALAHAITTPAWIMAAIRTIRISAVVIVTVNVSHHLHLFVMQATESSAVLTRTPTTATPPIHVTIHPTSRTIPAEHRVIRRIPIIAHQQTSAIIHHISQTTPAVPVLLIIPLAAMVTAIPALPEHCAVPQTVRRNTAVVTDKSAKVTAHASPQNALQIQVAKATHIIAAATILCLGIIIAAAINANIQILCIQTATIMIDGYVQIQKQKRMRIIPVQ